MNLTAEQIQENWDELMGYINEYISEPRKEKLLAFYEKYADRLILMPAAPPQTGCTAGGNAGTLGMSAGAIG